MIICLPCPDKPSYYPRVTFAIQPQGFPRPRFDLLKLIFGKTNLEQHCQRPVIFYPEDSSGLGMKHRFIIYQYGIIDRRIFDFASQHAGFVALEKRRDMETHWRQQWEAIDSSDNLELHESFKIAPRAPTFGRDLSHGRHARAVPRLK